MKKTLDSISIILFWLAMLAMIVNVIAFWPIALYVYLSFAAIICIVLFGQRLNDNEANLDNEEDECAVSEEAK